MQSCTSRQNLDLSTTVKQLHHHIHLTVDARLDLLTFLPHWSGRSSILDSHWTLNATMQLFTDASGHEGWVAYIGQAGGSKIIGHLNSMI